MKKYEYLLFDLDGTITDSSEGITKSVLHSLEYFDYELSDKSILRTFIGPPLLECFMRLEGFDREKASLAVDKYRERYRACGMYEFTVYPKIKEVFALLNTKGYKLVLATSKPILYAKDIIKKAELDSYFYHLGGAEIGGISTKTEVIERIIEDLEIKDISKMLMIGDTKYDLEGAQNIGIDAMGVLYGFGTKEELDEYPHIALAENAEDIAKFLP